MPDTPAADLLRTREAADRLRLSARTLDRWRTTGDGPAFVRLGRKAVAYRVRDLESWLARQTHEPDAA
jgi:predicted DNA-binding transcriptional regulator AlpA